MTSHHFYRVVHAELLSIFLIAKQKVYGLRFSDVISLFFWKLLAIGRHQNVGMRAYYIHARTANKIVYPLCFFLSICMYIVMTNTIEGCCSARA